MVYWACVYTLHWVGGGELNVCLSVCLTTFILKSWHTVIWRSVPRPYLVVQHPFIVCVTRSSFLCPCRVLLFIYISYGIVYLSILVLLATLYLIYVLLPSSVYSFTFSCIHLCIYFKLFISLFCMHYIHSLSFAVTFLRIMQLVISEHTMHQATSFSVSSLFCPVLLCKT